MAPPPASKSSAASGGELSDDELTTIDEYNTEDGKLRASIKWLITRVYDKNVPDQLVQPFVTDSNGTLHVTPPCMYMMTSGDLYCSAAAKIFQITDSQFLQQSHQAVLHELRRVGNAVMDPTSGEPVTETTLKMEAPLKITAHLAVIDALMLTYVRHSISVEKIMHSVSRYTKVEGSETPIDVEDALLFWINKICMAVRDNLEKMQKRAGGSVSDLPVIPEMEDLYEDMCDGACVAVVVAHYRPAHFPINEICLNDPMSFADCAYNLRLLKCFCAQQLPVNVFHFAVEDVLYLHENLQTNVQAFLIDLFHALEKPAPPVTNSTPTSPSESNKTQSTGGASVNRKRHEEIRAIPDLRGQHSNKASASSSFLRTRNPQLANNINPSLMNSADSLMTQRSVDSLRYQTFKVSNNKNGGHSSRQPVDGGTFTRSNTTTFGQLPASQTQAQPQEGVSEEQSYSRSDSMPGQAGVRLQMAERRRQIETQRAALTASLAKERDKQSKDAFFTLMGKPTKSPSPSKTPNSNNSSPQIDPSLIKNFTDQLQLLNSEVKRISMDNDKLARRFEEDVESQVATRMSQLHLHNPPTATQTNTNPANDYAHSSNGMSQSAYVPNRSGSSLGINTLLNNPSNNHNPYASPASTLTRNSRPHSVYNDQYQQPAYSPPQQQAQSFNLHQTPPAQGHSPLVQAMQAQQQPQAFGSPYHDFYGGYPAPAAPPLHQMQMSRSISGLPYAVNVPPAQQAPLTGLAFNQSALATGSPNHMAMNTQTIQANANSTQPQQATFRLHAETEPPSRLDPALEMNRNLTNWGMTYRSGQARQPRRTWDSEMWQQEMAKQNKQSPLHSIENQTAMHYGTLGRRPPSAILEHTALDAASGVPDPNAMSNMSVSMSSSQQPSTSFDVVMNNNPFTPAPGFVRQAKSAEPETARAQMQSASGTGMVVGDFVVGGSDAERLTLEQQQKREQLLANAMRRRERMEVKKQADDKKEAARREAQAKQKELAEQKKQEQEQRRQRIREEYDRKKAAEAAQDNNLLNPTTPRSPRRNTSQPPGRPKSTIVHSASMKSARSTHKLSQAASSTTVNLDAAGAAAGSSERVDLVGGRPRVPVASTQAPTIKPYVKPKKNSNRNAIINALNFTIFPNTVHEQNKQKVLNDMAKADSKHFLLLFRDKKYTYRGMYTWDEESNQISKLTGTGPKLITEDMMNVMFKYDNGGKSFNEIEGMRHLSCTVDAISIEDKYWKAIKPAAQAQPK